LRRSARYRKGGKGDHRQPERKSLSLAKGTGASASKTMKKGRADERLQATREDQKIN